MIFLFVNNMYEELLWRQIGSFGAITRIVNIVPKREDLLKIAAAGPLAGYSLGLILFLLGFILPPSDGLGIVVDAGVFHESFLVGGIGKQLSLASTNHSLVLSEINLKLCLLNLIICGEHNIFLLNWTYFAELELFFGELSWSVLCS